PWQGLALSDSTALEKTAKFEKTLCLNGSATQFKDAYNHGLVFTGPMLDFGFGITPTEGDFKWFYQAGLSAGVAFSRQMPAYAIGFMPLYGGADYLLHFHNTHRLRLRLAVSMAFHWQMYPFLHNPHLFYQTEIPLWFGINYAFHSPYGVFEAEAAFSVFGFHASTSGNEPYFYRLDFHEFVGKPLQELRFGFPNRYIHVLGAILYRPTALPQHAFGISVEYIGFTHTRRYQNLSYSLSWKKSF
ncbi:MAG: hypothetical protein K2I83_02175, partial [Bacteroidales bacterium]|nr:hypothetical protein [Bacteroidales bacterium]